MTLEWMKWWLNDHFLTLEWWIMTQMRVKWWNFWSKANALDFFLYHSILILTIFHHLTLIQWLKWVRNSFQSFNTQFHKSLPYPWDVIWYWCLNDLNYIGMREIFDGEDFDHPHPMAIPVILSHCEMSILSLYGHSNTEWPQNEGYDAGMIIFSSWDDG